MSGSPLSGSPRATEGGGVRSLLRRFRRDCRGAVAVEFAVSATAMFVFLFGVVEIGRLAFSQHTLDQALRQAGRQAIVRSDTSASPIDAAGVEAIVRLVADALDGSALVVTVSYPSGNSVGSPLTINAVYQFDVNAAFVPLTSVGLQSSYNGTIVN